MQFFVPHVDPATAEQTYAGIGRLVKDQMRVTIVPRRIYALKYTRDKKSHRIEVGGSDPNEGRCVVLAIYESAQVYMAFARSNSGGQGATILIAKNDVTEVIEFDPATATV